MALPVALHAGEKRALPLIPSGQYAHFPIDLNHFVKEDLAKRCSEPTTLPGPPSPLFERAIGHAG
jgi:hypothetical protein